MIRYLFLLILFICIVRTPTAKAQANFSELNFIALQKNQFQNTQNTRNFKNTMLQLKNLYQDGNQSMDILHLGNSHLQAGFYSEEIRDSLLTHFNPKSAYGYGLSFPFEAAETNNPGAYQVNYSGTWNHCKTSATDTSCLSGIFPITLKTNDSTASLSLKLQKKTNLIPYTYDRVKLFFLDPDNAYRIYINNQPVSTCNSNTITFTTQDQTDTLSILVNKKRKTDSSAFHLQGISLKNTQSLLHYHAVGSNGAKLLSYINSPYFPKQVKNINPQLVIISLGTNEAYDRNFDPKKFEKQLRTIIQLIRENTSRCWIHFNTPGDARWNHIHVNRNNKKARDIIVKVAEEMQCSYWDFYEVMGGKNAIELWHQHELAAEDKLHLKPKGYRIKGALFFDAFFDLFNTYTNGNQ